MNIQEAIKSGKRFRREGRSFMGPFPTTCGYIQYNDAKLSGLVKLKQEDILADDWEVVEEKKELTWQEIRDAFICNTNHYDVKKQLGFKED